MAAGLVPETAEPGIRSQHLSGLIAREQLDRRAEFRPLPHAPFGDLDAAGRMYRLNTAGLILLSLHMLATPAVDIRRDSYTPQRNEPFSRAPVPPYIIFPT